MKISYLGCDTLQFDRNFQKFLKTILPPLWRWKIEAQVAPEQYLSAKPHIILTHMTVILIPYISYTSPGIWKKKESVCRSLKGNVYQYYIIIYWQEEINIQNWKEWSTWSLFCYLEVFISSKCLFIRLFSISWECVPQGLHTALGDQRTCKTVTRRQWQNMAMSEKMLQHEILLFTETWEKHEKRNFHIYIYI